MYVCMYVYLYVCAIFMVGLKYKSIKKYTLIKYKKVFHSKLYDLDFVQNVHKGDIQIRLTDRSLRCSPDLY